MIPVSGEVDGPISEEETALFAGLNWGVLASTTGQPEEEKEMEMA